MEATVTIKLPDLSREIDKKVSKLKSEMGGNSYGRLLDELSSIKKILNKKVKPDKYEQLDIKPLVSKIDSIKDKLTALPKILSSTKSIAESLESQSYAEITQAIGKSTTKILQAVKANKPTDYGDELERLSKKLDKFSLPKIVINTTPHKQIVPYPV